MSLFLSHKRDPFLFLVYNPSFSKIQCKASCNLLFGYSHRTYLSFQSLSNIIYNSQDIYNNKPSHNKIFIWILFLLAIRVKMLSRCSN